MHNLLLVLVLIQAQLIIMLKIMLSFPARKLLQLNSITALLSRKHMDISFDRALKQTMDSKMPTIPPDVPLSLLPNVMPSLMSSLEQHGAILQLPPKPEFEAIKVTANTISLEWKMPAESVALDRTLTYSLHCYADVPAKLKVRLGMKKRLMSMVSPESGFEDMSDLSNESKSAFVSLPPSALGKRLANHQDPATNQGTALRSGDQQRPETTSNAKEDQEISEGQLVLKPSTTGRNISSLLPEPIRLPQPIGSESKIPPTQIPIAAAKPRSLIEQEQFHSGALLNLPPLIVNKSSTQGIAMLRSESETELISVTTSGVFADSEDGGTVTPTREIERRMSTVDEDRAPSGTKHRVSKTDSSSELSTTSEDLSISEYTNLGRLCCGFAFEEIFCGEQLSFHYSGLVAGASYYFRVRCHNAAGWGPWSDTVKCMTTLN